MSDFAFPEKLAMCPGASTILEAPGHGAGGYVWTARVDAGPGSIEELNREQPGAAVGAGATASFRLTWEGDEAGAVTLVLKRPWERESVESHRILIEPCESGPEA